MTEPGIDEARLRRGLGQAALARVVERIAKRLARARNQPDIGFESLHIVITDPTPAELDAYGAQLGQNLAARKNLTVRFADLDRELREANIAPDLVSAIAVLRGDLLHGPARREAEVARWRQLFADAATRDRRPTVQAWLDDLQSTGLLRSLTRSFEEAEALLANAMRLIEHLPTTGQSIKEFAARWTGDAHGLDGDKTVNTLVLRFAQQLIETGLDDRPTGVSRQFSLWQALGLSVDTLSSDVWVAGLQADRGTHTGRFLSEHAAAGEPYCLSLRALLTAPPRFLSVSDVYICENPAVLQAAVERLAPGHQPLICIEGRPSLAANLLLERLAESGSTLHYHGDFDWPGLQIANQLHHQHGANPWRMCAADYRAAEGHLQLTGAPVDACWDADLAPAMKQRQIAIHEEAVLNQLLADLQP